MTPCLYQVIATVWSDEQKKPIEVVAGTFDRCFNAILFRDAYNAHFHATARIVEYKRT